MLAFLTLLPLKNYINSSTKQRVWPFRRYNWLIWHVRTTSLQHRMGRKSVFIFVVRWLIWIQSKFTLFCWENINSFITFLKCILINTGSIDSTSTVVHVSHAYKRTFTCSCENKRKVKKKKKKKHRRIYWDPAYFSRDGYTNYSIYVPDIRTFDHT